MTMTQQWKECDQHDLREFALRDLQAVSWLLGLRAQSLQNISSERVNSLLGYILAAATGEPWDSSW